MPSNIGAAPHVEAERLGKNLATASSEASPYNIQLSSFGTPGKTHVEGLEQESAIKASELLMLNHAKYHTLFNMIGGLHSKNSEP